MIKQKFKTGDIVCLNNSNRTMVVIDVGEIGIEKEHSLELDITNYRYFCTWYNDTGDIKNAGFPQECLMPHPHEKKLKC